MKPRRLGRRGQRQRTCTKARHRDRRGAGEAPGPGAFEERTLEVRETQEEPVVNKTANVVEEVVIGRESTERTETVRDTVRKEEVEITGDGRATPIKPTI